MVYQNAIGRKTHDNTMFFCECEKEKICPDVAVANFEKEKTEREVKSYYCVRFNCKLIYIEPSYKMK